MMSSTVHLPIRRRPLLNPRSCATEPPGSNPRWWKPGITSPPSPPLSVVSLPAVKDTGAGRSLRPYVFKASRMRVVSVHRVESTVVFGEMPKSTAGGVVKLTS